MSHKGSCHCGQITFEVQGSFEKAVECNCSHCSRKGYLLWFVPKSSFSFQAAEGSLSTYTFNKHAIKHHFCAKCGCAPFGFGAMGGTEMVAVNVRCIEGVELSSVTRELVDGRSF